MPGIRSQKRAWVLLFLITSSIACPGCVMFMFGIPSPGRWHDIAPTDPEWGGYVYDAVYELPEAVFLADLKHYSYGPALAPDSEIRPRKRDPQWGGEMTVAEYKADPKLDPDIMGVVDAGTRLRATRIRKKVYAKHDVEHFVVYAVILDGPHAGETVEITELSLHVESGAWPLKPNELLLRRVTP